MITIGIDGNEANVPNRVGIGQYAFELLKQFSESQSTSWRKNLEFRIYLKNKPMPDLPKQKEGWEYIIVKPAKLWTQFGMPLKLFLSKPRPDVFFTPSHYAPRFSPIPTVISIMDMSFILFPQLFKKSDLYQLKNWTAYSAKKAAKILTISNASKNDIIKIYKVKGENIIVTYLGLRPTLKTNSANMEEVLKKYNVRKPFILFVGTLQPRKNTTRLIEAFSKLKKEEISLVIIGKRGWLYEEILQSPKRLGVEKRVLFLDFVSDEELPSFYKAAEVFVLPSLYEGFGLPVLEAMQHGCPVITSNVSSLPEAGGDAALYINPENVDEIAATIEEVLTNEKKRNTMIEKGKEQVKKFSWEKTAKETLDVLIEVGKK